MDLDNDEWFTLYQKSAEGKLANYDQITDQIFLGGFAAAEHKELLQSVLKIDAVLTVANYLEPQFPELFKYKVVEIEDSIDQDLKQHFRECI